MAIEIKSTKNLKADAVKCLVYGGPGVGKTVLCSTAPSPIVISAEGGMLSLHGKDVPFVEVKSPADVDAVYRLVATSEYQTICLDSISEIAEVLLVDLKTSTNDPRQAYGKMAEGMMAMIRKFRDLPGKHIVFIAKEERKEDDTTGIILTQPIMPGQVTKTQLPYMVDLVMHMGIDKAGNRFLQTVSDRQKHCKDRSGKLEEREPPDLTYIFEKIGA